jgi:2,4-dienoyl-CoA reductase (NADPH2)
VVNPSAGHETAVAPPRRRSLAVTVVGGGPAGLQAAVSAAGRGHRVTLYERDSELGGQVALAARVPSRAELLDLVRDLAAEARRLGVAVETGVDASAALLAADDPDVVVLATGAEPVRPSWAARDAADAERIVDVRDVLAGRADPAGSVLVFDELGFHQATSVAELLADRGCAVEIVTTGMVVGQDLGVTLDLELWTIKAAARGIRCTTDMVPLGSTRGVTLRLLHHPTGTEHVRTVDWVVCAVHQRPADALWQELRGSALPVHRIGDCLAPRRAHAAVIEGRRVAMAL